MAFEQADRLAALQVPEPQRSVLEAETARRPSGVTATALTQSAMAFERAERLAGLQVPEPQRSVTRSRDGTAPIGRYRHGLDRSPYGLRACGSFGHSPGPRAAAYGLTRPRRHGGRRASPPRPLTQAGMAFERADRLAALQVPEPQRLVKRGRYGTAAVGRHHHGGDRASMAFERPDRLAALQVPEPQRIVIGTPRRHGGRRASPPRRRPSSYGLRAGGSFGRSPSPRAAAYRPRGRHGRRPSGVTATAMTEFVWPSKVRIEGPPGAVRLRCRGRSHGQAFPPSASLSKTWKLGVLSPSNRPNNCPAN